MINKIKNLLVFALLTFAMSCQKKDNTPADTTLVTVLFTSLTYGQVFHKGDTIPVNALVSYPGEIVGVFADISDSATGELFYEDNADTHTDNFNFQRSWEDTLSSETTLQVKITVFLASNTSKPAERVIYVKSVP
jgi:hypothetical protein